MEVAKPSGKLNVDEGRPTADKSVLAHVEAVMERWSKQADELLGEQDSDNPSSGLMDVRGPREEIDFWKTRFASQSLAAIQDEVLSRQKCGSDNNVATETAQPSW